MLIKRKGEREEKRRAEQSKCRQPQKRVTRVLEGEREADSICLFILLIFTSLKIPSAYCKTPSKFLVVV